MQHLLSIETLEPHLINQLIQRALLLKQQRTYPCVPHYTVANLFYENSTRTRISFELAAKRLGMKVINFDQESSSEQKGEIIEDTVHTLAAMGIQLFVVRHATNRLPQSLAALCPSFVHIINAGDGTHAHPSQALLDGMTIVERKPKLDQLKIAIVGNIRHSRVAHSLEELCAKLGVGELMMVAPKLWQPETTLCGTVTDSLKEGLLHADVVICLRVQKERLLADEVMDLEEYQRLFCVTSKNLSHAKSDVMLMHPGPVNRGVEVESALVDGERSFILEQVNNGVFMRMAILEALAK